ncbi:MAG: hypothetical protein ACFFBP_05290 [Promethearchaeota archaeon]
MEQKNLSYSFYVIAPFNSRMVFNNLNLIGKYEDIRKLLYQKMNKKYPEQVLIEKLGKVTSDSETIQRWLGELENVSDEEEDIRLFKGTGGSGVTQKDKSIITIMIDQEFELSLDVFGHDIFTTPPKIVLETMSFHEYGVGTIYCKLNINLKQDLLQISEIPPKKLLTNLLDISVTHPPLLKATQTIGEDVYQNYLEIIDELELDEPIISYENLFTDQKSSIPLWGHIVIVREDIDDTQEELVNTLLEKLIDISHPDGSIDFAEGTKGYVHIGWGNSLWTGLNDIELNYAKEILRYCEVEWRTLQVFNEILYKRLNQFASYDKLHKRLVKKTMLWIDALRMEMELYSLNKSNYLQNLAPFAHFIYNEALESWRISQMEDFFKEKLEVFEYLHQQGRDTLNEISDSRINNILFVFTCLSLVSTFIDGLVFVSADHLSEFFIFRLFLLVFPPTAFIILILMFFARFGASKKKRRRKK